MLSPYQNAPQITLTLPGASPRHSSGEGSRKNSPLPSPRLKKDKDNNILIRACCPNCRYVFKVVDDNKLNRVKDKLAQMDNILYNKNFNQIPYPTNKNTYERLANPKKDIEQNVQIKRSQTPKFTQRNKSPKSKPVSPRQITPKPLQRSPTPKKPSTSPTSDRKSQNQQKMIKMQEKQSPIKKINNVDEQRGVSSRELYEDQVSLKEDIKTMKKYLNQLSPSESKIRQHNASLNTSNKGAEESWIQKINKSSMMKADDRYNQNHEFIEDYSSIPKKQSLEIHRKCQHCSAGHIQIETALSAAKSQLVQKQIAMMSHYIDRDTSTPSYIKGLQQISQFC